MHRRSVRLGLLTIFGLARRGFFIPYRFADKLPAPGTVRSYNPVEAMLRSAEANFQALIDYMGTLEQEMLAIRGSAAPEPRWDQDWFPTLDAAATYALVRQAKPRRIVEIGSGHSTRFLYRAITDGGFDCTITAIDPVPSRGVDTLPIDLRADTLNDVDPMIFEGLSPGDILFVDSSHILVPGSDVDDIMNRILPLLPAGVLLHVHDIFLPDDYPKVWDWRGYNEQSAVALLITTGAYEPLFASHYVATRMTEALSASFVSKLPTGQSGHPASLWLRKK
jgi:hypothetical protein